MAINRAANLLMLLHAQERSSLAYGTEDGCKRMREKISQRALPAK
jgi:hypothetical protein